MVKPRRPKASRLYGAQAVLCLALGSLLVGCASEDAVPLDEFTTTTLVGPHAFEPTDQMIDLANQQCLDDPTLDEGVVQAVDPNNSDDLLGEYRVDCSTARG